MQAEIITAPADGLAPSLLLTLDTRPLKSQYLFNVPEGFSRYVLEHKIRPNLGLRALFLHDAASATGLPSLLMRLRGEGHGSLEIFGPPKTFQYVSSLRHFVHWRHPAVFVTDIDTTSLFTSPTRAACRDTSQDETANTYQDEHIIVSPVIVNSAAGRDDNAVGGGTYNVGSEWSMPSWLKELLQPSRTTGNILSNSTDDDDDDDAVSRSSNSTSTSGSCSDDKQQHKHISKKRRKESSIPRPSNSVRDALFAKLNEDFMHQSQSQHHRSTTITLHGRQYKHCNTMHNISIYSRTDGKETVPSKDKQTQHEDNNSMMHQHSLENTPCSATNNDTILAYAVYIKSLRKVLIIANIKNHGDMDMLFNHHGWTSPILQQMHHHDKIAALVAFIDPVVSCNINNIINMNECVCPGVNQESSISAMNSIASTLHKKLFFVEYPGGASSTQLGYMSSSRTMVRLNMVHNDFFPLPYALLSTLKNEKHSNGMHRSNDAKECESRRAQRVSWLTRLLSDVNSDLCIQHADSMLFQGQSMSAILQGIDDSVPLQQQLLDQKDSIAFQEEILKQHPQLQVMIQEMKQKISSVQTDQLQECPGQRDGISAAVFAQSNKSAAALFKQKLLGRSEQQAVQSQQPKDSCTVLFLGTGSAEPSKHRNASAIHFTTRTSKGMLLDCGEGTMCQLIRLYGRKKALECIGNLGCIWVSHRHADHMAGVLHVLLCYYQYHSVGKSKFKNNDTMEHRGDKVSSIQHHRPRPPSGAAPLLIIGPLSLRKWLAEAMQPIFASFSDVAIMPYTFVHCQELLNSHHWVHSFFLSSLGVSQVIPVAVRHCRDAYGIVLQFDKGKHLVYSGDTEPSENLIQAGKNATLLIHEATFEPQLEREARKKKHSTTAEAIESARRMNAKWTILTHFSQRYPKFPEGIVLCNDEKVKEDQHPETLENVGVAFDCMRVDMDKLKHLPLLMPVVAAVLRATSSSNPSS